MMSSTSVYHLKSGGRYTVLRHNVPVQCSTGSINEGDGVTIYASANGHWYCRKTSEFCDGRFAAADQAGGRASERGILRLLLSVTFRDLVLAFVLLFPILVLAGMLIGRARDHSWVMPKNQDEGFSRYYWTEKP